MYDLQYVTWLQKIKWFSIFYIRQFLKVIKSSYASHTIVQWANISLLSKGWFIGPVPRLIQLGLTMSCRSSASPMPVWPSQNGCSEALWTLWTKCFLCWLTSSSPCWETSQVVQLLMSLQIRRVVPVRLKPWQTIKQWTFLSSLRVNSDSSCRIKIFMRNQELVLLAEPCFKVRHCLLNCRLDKNYWEKIIFFYSEK